MWHPQLVYGQLIKIKWLLSSWMVKSPSTSWYGKCMYTYIYIWIRVYIYINTINNSLSQESLNWYQLQYTVYIYPINWLNWPVFLKLLKLIRPADWSIKCIDILMRQLEVDSIWDPGHIRLWTCADRVKKKEWFKRLAYIFPKSCLLAISGHTSRCWAGSSTWCILMCPEIHNSKVESTPEA